MRDLDELLTSEISQRAAEAGTPPPFADLVERGARRRRQRRTALSGGVATVAAAALLLVQLPNGAQRSDPTLPGATSTTAGASEPTPEQIIEDPGSRLLQLAVSPTDPDLRASVWQWCRTSRCTVTRFAVAITADGFRTRSAADLSTRKVPSLLGLGGGRVLVAQDLLSHYLVSAAGTVEQIVRTSQGPTPVRDGEVVFRDNSAFLAVDLETGSWHRVNTPRDASEVLATPGGQLRALSYRVSSGVRYHVSDDGGVSWSTTTITGVAADHFELVASVDEDVHAVLEGAGGNADTPFTAVHRSGDPASGWTREPAVEAPIGLGASSAVLADGRLVTVVVDWSAGDERDASASPGIYASLAEDWSRYASVQQGGPYADQGPFEPILIRFDVSANGVGITLAGPSGTNAYESEDLGETWQELEAR